MIVHYSYLTFDGQEHGDFECTLEDFRQFLRGRINTDVRCIVVKFDDGRVYLWQRDMVKIKRSDYHNGWALALNKTPTVISGASSI